MPKDIPGFLVELVDSYERREGTGDNVTSVPTRSYGVTKKAYKSLNNNKLSDKEAALMISGFNLDLLTDRMEGFETAPTSVKKMILDTSYNVGVYSVLKWKGLSKSVKERNWAQSARDILNTANVKGSSVKGLAKRRAESANYVISNIPKKLFGVDINNDIANKALEMLDAAKIKPTDIFKSQPIREIEQQDDGTIIYKDLNQNEIFKYKPRVGKHNRSSVGRVVMNGLS